MKYSAPAAGLAALLTVEETGRADRLAIESGTCGLALMEAAGKAVAAEVMRRLPEKAPVAVLCGPGNNGGDGFVVARLLRDAGWPVRLGLLRGAVPGGDAAHMAAQWKGTVEGLSPALLQGAALVVDALFGAGLNRPLEGDAAMVVADINARQIPCIAVDVPSGLDGDTGTILGDAPCCVATVTFFRAKPGQVLYPGRAKVGALVVADIGIPDRVIEMIAPATFLNGTAMWQLPHPQAEDHKYTRGHALVLGGGAMTGAGRLAVRAARRVGAGLVTIAAPAEVLPIYAIDAPGALHVGLDRAEAFDALLEDPRRNAVLLGPGGGHDMALRGRVLKALSSDRAVTLDADALTVFADEPALLFDALHDRVVLTPHDGEAYRLFGPLDGSRLSRARIMAHRARAVVVLKGSDTVIAAPDGRAAINRNAPPDLATAGSGDVLAGLVVGLQAQGMPAWEAACCAVWLHGEAGRAVGTGLIAEDLPDALPSILHRLRVM